MKALLGFIVGVALTCLVWAASGLFMPGGPGAATQNRVERVDTVIVRDTVKVTTPQYVAQSELGLKAYTIPAVRIIGTGFGGIPRAATPTKKDSTDTEAAQTDSTTVLLPTVQRHYANTHYDAWVSGPIDPRLDSINVYPQTMAITRRTHPSRWAIALSAGAAITPRGIQPFVGVGVSYALWRR